MPSTAKDVMTPTPSWLELDSSVQEAATVPVVDNGTPAGVVTLGDLVVDLDRDSALADISTAPANT